MVSGRRHGTEQICKVCTQFEKGLARDLTLVFRITIHRGNDVMERGTSTFCIVSIAALVVQRSARRQYTVPLLWHVASNICLAC